MALDRSVVLRIEVWREPGRGLRSGLVWGVSTEDEKMEALQQAEEQLRALTYEKPRDGL